MRTTFYILCAAFLVWLVVYAINGSVRDAQRQQSAYMEASK